MKCSFVDYVQFLIIGRAIQATKIDQNAKKGPLSHQKHEIIVFGLHSISDDWPSNPSNERRPKYEKGLLSH